MAPLRRAQGRRASLYDFDGLTQLNRLARIGWRKYLRVENKLYGVRMSLGFSAENRIRKTDLLANAREKYTILCDKINELNTVLEAATSSVEVALADYGKAVQRLDHFKDAMRREHSQVLAADKADPERHDLVSEWLELWASFRARVPRLTLPRNVAHPDDNLLSEFEELPDYP